MQDKLVYHEDAILYNEAVAKVAESLPEQLRDPEIKKWARAVAKQHRHHLKRHRSALRKLQAGEEAPSVEVLPEGLDVPPAEEEPTEAEKPSTDVIDDRAGEEQKAEVAAELSSVEASAEADDKSDVDVDYRSAKTGQFVSEKFAESHPSTTVSETNERPMKPVTPNPSMLDKNKKADKPSMFYNSQGQPVSQEEYEAEQAAEGNANA